MKLPANLVISVLLLTGAGLAHAETTYRFESVGHGFNSATEASELFYPSGVAVDADGTVWVADTANHVIRRMTRDGRMEVVAGIEGLPGADDGRAAASTFRYPQGLAFDLAGTLYIADSGNGVIRRLRTDGVVETYAGHPNERGTVNGTRDRARFITPIGLAWDITGELWVSDFSAHTIRRIGSDGRVTTVSGEGGTPDLTDGPREHARFHNPAGIDIDAQGRLWVADSGNGAIRIVTPDGFTTTIAGVDGVQEHRDGTLAESRFDNPSDLAIRDDGTVFVADSWSHTIRVIRGDEVGTIAGSPGSPGHLNGNGLSARFHHPLAIALAPDGTIYVADMANHELREGTESDFGSGRRRATRR